MSRCKAFLNIMDRRSHLELAKIGCTHENSLVYSNYAAIDLCGVTWYMDRDAFLVIARCASCCKIARFYASEIHGWVITKDFPVIRDEMAMAQRSAYKCACKHESLLISSPYTSKGEIFINVLCRNCGIIRPISARKIDQFEGYYL